VRYCDDWAYINTAEGRGHREARALTPQLGQDVAQRDHVHQTAEWGTGSMQKVYSRLELPLPYDPEVRGRRLNNIFRLANYRVRTVGISQIRSTFSGELESPYTL